MLKVASSFDGLWVPAPTGILAKPWGFLLSLVNEVGLRQN